MSIIFLLVLLTTTTVSSSVISNNIPSPSIIFISSPLSPESQARPFFALATEWIQSFPSSSVTWFYPKHWSNYKLHQNITYIHWEEERNNNILRMNEICVEQSLQPFINSSSTVYHTLMSYFSKQKSFNNTIIVSDRFVTGVNEVCETLRITCVLNNPFVLWDLDSPPGYIPAPETGYDSQMTSTVDRYLNSYWRFKFRLSMLSLIRPLNDFRREIGLPVLKKYPRDNTLVLINTVFGIEHPRALPPLFHMVGSIESLSGNNNSIIIPKDVLEWIEISNNVVVVSIDQHLKEKISFADKRVLWISNKNDSIAINDKYVMTTATTGALLKEILSHVNVEWFISSGDLLDVQESIIAGTRVIVFPTIAMQREVGLRMENYVPGGCFLANSVSSIINIIMKSPTAAVLCEEEFIKTTASLRYRLQNTASVQDVVALIVNHHQSQLSLVPLSDVLPLYKIYLLDVYALYGVVLAALYVVSKTTWTVTVTWWKKVYKNQV